MAVAIVPFRDLHAPNGSDSRKRRPGKGIARKRETLRKNPRSHRSRRSGWIVSLILALSSGLVSGFELQSVVLSSEPTIDGVIDEEVWSEAAVAEGFIQIEPSFGEASPFPTTVRVGITDRALFVAFVLSDPEPDRIAGAVTTRDGNLDNDDSVGVLIDTFNDQHTGYFFRSNLLGTQEDGRIANNGRTVDRRWDAAWQCAANRTTDGWSVEFEIPFDILKYRAGGERVWGINFLRTVPRRLETSVWSGPGESQWRVSQFGAMVGLELPIRGAKRFQVIPYALAVVEEDWNTEFEAGGDLRYRITNNLGADLTVNPDFAIVEADVEEINLTRFELFIPEKRPFFLEGGEMFSQRIRQFYSRRIGEIDWGAKLTGKAGATDLNVLHTDGNYGDPDADGIFEAIYSVARFQRGFGASNVGFLAANRRLEGEDAGSVGFDTTLFFTEKLGMTAQLLRVHGPERDGGLAWFVRPAWDTSTSHFHVRYTNLDAGILEDFNAAGFLKDDDRKEFDTALEHTFWLESGALEKIKVDTNYNRFWSQQDVLRSWELEGEISFVLRSGWWFEVDYLDEFKLFEKEFRNQHTKLEVGWDSRTGRSAAVFVGTGTNFDSDLLLYGLELEWKLSDRWNLSYSLTRLELDPDPELETTVIHVFNTDYYFNPNLLIRVFFQSNSAIDKENVQTLLVWRFLPPFGSLQVAYQRGTSEFGTPSEQGDTLFTKLQWVF
jgi:hypothetical protein